MAPRAPRITQPHSDIETPPAWPPVPGVSPRERRGEEALLTRSPVFALVSTRPAIACPDLLETQKLELLLHDSGSEANVAKNAKMKVKNNAAVSRSVSITIQCS